MNVLELFLVIIALNNFLILESYSVRVNIDEISRMSVT